HRVDGAGAGLCSEPPSTVIFTLNQDIATASISCRTTSRRRSSARGPGLEVLRALGLKPLRVLPRCSLEAASRSEDVASEVLRRPHHVPESPPRPRALPCGLAGAGADAEPAADARLIFPRRGLRPVSRAGLARATVLDRRCRWRDRPIAGPNRA